MNCAPLPSNLNLTGSDWTEGATALGKKIVSLIPNP